MPGTKTNNSCYHCGEDLGRQPVVAGDKEFCCNGCRTVYEILSASDACEYYSFSERPGIRLSSWETGERYSYLDVEEIKKELLLFSDSGISRARFFIPAIHCSSCIWLLEKLHRLHPGIMVSNVNFNKREVEISFKDDKISLRQVVELLASIHYIPEINLDNAKEKAGHRADVSIYYRLGVAGFCFGNIMLFSFPEYLGGGSLENFLRQDLRWLNLLFSLPVMFYSGSVYLVSAYKGLRKRFIGIDVPIAIGMIMLFSRSAWEILSNTGPGYMDSLAGLIFFLLIGKWYQGKTYDALSFERDYRSYFPVSATIIDDQGNEQIIPLKNLKAGLRLLIRNMELIPADAYLVAGAGNIDYSFVSGESTPVIKQKGDKVFAGGRQMGGAIEVIVEKEVMQSYLTDLWNKKSNEKLTAGGMTQLMNRIGGNFTKAVLLIAAAAGITWMFINPGGSVNVVISILIVACPCALALSIPFAYGNTMRIYGRKGFYLKQAEVVETLAGTSDIVFDKTGTITQNDRFEINMENLAADENDLRSILSLVRHSTHPVSIAIYRHLQGRELFEVTGFKEEVSKGLSGRVNGHDILLGSVSLAGNGVISGKAKGNRVFVSIDGQARGYFLFSNKYRDGLYEIIGKLKDHYELHLLSGDNDAELPYLLPLFGKPENLHFFQSPHDKLNYILDLKKSGKTVLMAGDGLNDAGALQASDVGISIADEVYHFSPACDAILDSGNFAGLADFIRFSRTSVKIVKVSIFISLVYNLTGMSIAAMGLLTPIIAAILMPASSVTVVAFVTLSVVLAGRRGLK